MKKVSFIMAFLMGVGMLMAQEQKHVVSEGDVLTLSAPSGSEYQHINFPKKNFILKRGAIADFKSLVGEQLVVQDVTAKADGSTETILKRKDGTKFFRFYPSVSADLENALLSGELKKSNTMGQNSIAQR